jgi:hypothetical protein
MVYFNLALKKTIIFEEACYIPKYFITIIVRKCYVISNKVRLLRVHSTSPMMCVASVVFL